MEEKNEKDDVEKYSSDNIIKRLQLMQKLMIQTKIN